MPEKKRGLAPNLFLTKQTGTSTDLIMKLVVQSGSKVDAGEMGCREPTEYFKFVRKHHHHLHTTTSTMTGTNGPEEDKPKKKRGGSKPILKGSGIGRVDNGLKSTTFLTATPINQKNYYTDYLKKDHHIMALRELAEREKLEKEKEKDDKNGKTDATASASANADEETENAAEDDVRGSKTIVIHPGSRNLRIGLASQAYPKTIPFVIAHKMRKDPVEEEDTEMENVGTESQYQMSEEEFDAAYATVYRDFRERMKFYKRRILPNAHDLVANYNRKSEPEEIADHNDPSRVEWTDLEELGYPDFLIGEEAVRVPHDSKPHYMLRWPIKNGLFNEADYSSQQEILGDVSVILCGAIHKHLDIKSSNQLKQYNTVLIIPDLYDKTYVSNMIELCLGMGFANVSIIQESTAATFGAGVSTACVVDVGAEKTSITCVEEGMCITDSRVNLKYGGDDVTVALSRLFQKSSFPGELNLKLSHGWLLAEELKRNFASMNDGEITVQLNSFYQRSPARNHPTLKYQFKYFDEVMLAPLGLFYPQLFELEHKLDSRYTLFPRSFDIYDKEEKWNDPISDAQINVYKKTLAVWGSSYMDETNLQSSQNGGGISNVTANGTPGSPSGTPAPAPTPIGESAQAKAAAHSAFVASQLQAQQQMADRLDPRAVVAVGLDHAIIESIIQAAQKSTASSEQSFYESILIVGGGAKIADFEQVFIDRIHMWRDNAATNAQKAVPDGEIQIMAPPRDMDPQIVTWKGGSVFAKLKIINEVWINARDWDMQGSRILHYKALFAY